MKKLLYILRTGDPLRQWPLWILLILLLRIPILMYFMHQGNIHFPERMTQRLVLKEVDYGYFLLPVDRYFEEGLYSFDGVRPYAGRMPGYAAPYYLLRLFLSQDAALVTLILLQIILAAISVFFLALLAHQLSRSRRVFYLTLLFYGTSLYFLRYDFSSITESPSTALFILFLYQVFSYWEDERLTRLLWAGFFLTWTLFLRPFQGYLLLPIGIMLLIKGFQGERVLWRQLRPAFLFCLPFLIIEGCWVIRNYEAFGRFIPTEMPIYESYGKTYAKTWIEMRSFAASLDIESAYFEPGLAHWFRAASDKEASTYVMPDAWFEGVEFNRDSLENLRSLYHRYKEEPDTLRYLEMEAQIIPIAARYHAQVKAARPLTYQVWNRMENIRRRVFSSGSSYVLLPPFDQMDPFQKFLKLYASACYYLVIIMGSWGILYLWKRSRHSVLKTFLIITVIHCLFLPILLALLNATLENRYLFSIYPLLTVCMIIFLNSLYERRSGMTDPALDEP